MWINEKTGKGWSDEEEAAFAQLMEAGGMERLPAIRLYRRMDCNLEKALRHAKEQGELRHRTDQARKEKRFKGGTFRAAAVGDKSKQDSGVEG